MFYKIRIRQHERGLRFRYGDYKALLAPGTYRLWSRFLGRARAHVEVVNTLTSRFEHPMLDVLLKHDRLRDELLVLELNDDQRALIWKDDRLAWVLGPGRHAFWKTPYDLRTEVFDVQAVRFEHERMEAVARHPDAANWLSGIEVDANEEVLLFRNGRLQERLTDGKHVFWTGAGRITWKAVELREQTLDIAGQEIMTRDKVSLRVNLLVTYRVADPVKAVLTVSDFAQSLYREAQLVLRAAVGTRNLDALLTDKETAGAEVMDALRSRVAEFGLIVKSVGLRDIILPGDMKTILNQVIEAEKQAQANLIRRREETAAARSQANTAKVLADNPILARMKELEMLQEILDGAKTTFVFGQGDLSEQIRGLTASD